MKDSRIKKSIIIVSILLSLAMLYKILPFCFIEKPNIEMISPNEIMENTAFNDTGRITIQGKHLKNITGIYINGVYEHTAINELDENQIEAFLPTTYLSKEGKLDIRVEARVNGEITCLSNTKTIDVLSTKSLTRPVIQSSAPAVLEVSDLITHKLELEGENFDCNSVVYIDGEKYSTKLEEDGKLTVNLDYRKWCTKQALSIQVNQYYNGYPTNIKSNEYYLEIEGKGLNEYPLTYSWVSNYLIANVLGGIEESYNQGNRVFKANLAFTGDEVLIVEQEFESKVDEKEESKEEKVGNLPSFYANLKDDKLKQEILTFDEICKLLEKYKDIYIVTDTKQDSTIANEKVFNYIVEHAKQVNSDILKRMIIQVYSEEMYRQVMETYPFQSVIYVANPLETNQDKIIDIIKKTGIKAVAIDCSQVTAALTGKLNDLDVYVYVQTVNKASDLEEYIMNGIRGFYTDLLSEKEVYSDLEAARNKYLKREKLLALNQAEKYLEALEASPYQIIISVKDDAGIKMNDEIQNRLFKMGAKIDLRGKERNSYILILDGGKVVFEKLSQSEKIQYDTKLGEQMVHVESAGFDSGDYSSIVIDGNECSINARGINMVVLDTHTEKLIDKINIDVYGDMNFIRDLNQDTNFKQYKKNYNRFKHYLSESNSERYLKIFAVKDEGSKLVTDEIQNLLFALGLNQSLKDKYRYSYIGVINGKDKLYNECVEQDITYQDEIMGLDLLVESARDHSSIKINGIEYSKDCRGMNIVVYDKLLEKVIDSISFDLYEGYNITN